MGKKLSKLVITSLNVDFYKAMSEISHHHEKFLYQEKRVSYFLLSAVNLMFQCLEFM